MNDSIKIGLKFIWYGLLLYWLISGVGAKKSKNREPILKRFTLYWLPLIVAGLLLGPGEWFGHTWWRENFVPHTDFVGYTGLAIALAGGIIACWSRYLLGKNWSVSVQEKENHVLIKNGLYKYVRHPIYTGLLLLFAGNALIVGDYRGIVAVIIVFCAFWYKLKKEEKLLTEIFDSRYLEYKSGTKAIFPYIL
ncbi:MAG TPA: isoprenylcysteine carboxylmethyltransferase family protein [Bacteroidia bacterium]|nr:isoprenylcysteine carboxylmethyltransferase family protein [Bacteroidia bacterium]